MTDENKIVEQSYSSWRELNVRDAPIVCKAVCNSIYSRNFVFLARDPPTRNFGVNCSLLSDGADVFASVSVF